MDKREAEQFARRVRVAREEAERFKMLTPEVVELSPEAYDTFMAALENPKPPTPALVELMRRPRT